MKIYESEILDNLQEAVTNSAVARCEFSLAPRPTKAQASANVNQPDLFYIDDCILVSTNWNGNNDVFAKEEVWPARKTPKDKQFNHMHDDSFIIGHITDCRAMDYDGNIIPDDTPLDKLPEFDISISSVLYTKFSDEERSKLVANIINELPTGKWFVSMECLFSDFDYAVISPEGDQRVIARNNDSAFLTKHLRQYGGTGEYQGYKLGRLLRNIVFSGVGSVDNPANKRSKIRSFSFNGAKASIQYLSEKKMTTDATATLVQSEPMVTKAQYDELKQELNQAKAFVSEASKKEMEDMKKEKAELDKTLASVQNELTLSQSLAQEKTEKIQALETEITQLKAALESAKAEMDKAKEEKKAECRLNELIKVGVEATKASKLVEKFATASDEMFAEVVSLNTKAADCMKEEKEEKKTDASQLDKVVAEKTTIPQNTQDTGRATAATAWVASILNKKGE